MTSLQCTLAMMPFCHQRTLSIAQFLCRAPGASSPIRRYTRNPNSPRSSIGFSPNGPLSDSLQLWTMARRRMDRRNARYDTNMDFLRNGANEIRTHDLLHAMQALSQLSYGPETSNRRRSLASGDDRHHTNTSVRGLASNFSDIWRHSPHCRMCGQRAEAQECEGRKRIDTSAGGGIICAMLAPDARRVASA